MKQMVHSGSLAKPCLAVIKKDEGARTITQHPYTPHQFASLEDNDTAVASFLHARDKLGTSRGEGGGSQIESAAMAKDIRVMACHNNMVIRRPAGEQRRAQRQHDGTKRTPPPTALERRRARKGKESKGRVPLRFFPLHLPAFVLVFPAVVLLSILLYPSSYRSTQLCPRELHKA